jgi:2-iminobutanoate/2-iminopropanoate deaminase
MDSSDRHLWDRLHNRISTPNSQKDSFEATAAEAQYWRPRRTEGTEPVQIRQINAATVTVPTSGYSQALELQGHSRMLFISGQTPVALDGSVPEGFEAQCRLAWQNVEAQLAAAGMTLDNIVLHRTFLADRRYTMANRTVRQAVLGDRKPALTTIIAGIFDEAWLIEIEAIAAA